MISGVKVKDLKVIKDDRGFLMEMLRCDDLLFEKFGQVYLSVCNPGYVKGWHYHKIQTDNFIVVNGNARVLLYDNRPDSSTKGQISEFEMGENNPILVSIPPGVLHGIECKGDEPCHLINCPTEKYIYDKPDEYRIDPFNNDIPAKWNSTKGG